MTAFDDLLAQHFDNQIRGFGAGGAPAGVSAGTPAPTLDAATQARLAASRAADTAAVNASRAQVAGAASADASTAAPAVSAKTGFGVRAAVRGVGRFLNPEISLAGAARLAKPALAAAPVLGALETAATPQDEMRQFAGSLGLNYDTFGGRVGSNVAKFLQNTGNSATFGVAGRVGRVLAGGSFFDSDPPAAAAPAAAPAVAPAATAAPVAPTASSPSGAPSDASQATDPVTGAVYKSLQYTPPAAPQPTVTSYSSQPYGGGYIDGPNGRVQLPSGTTTTFGVRRPSLSDNINYAVERGAARRDYLANVEGAKLGVGLVGARMKSADQMLAMGKLNAASAWMQAHPGDYGGYAAILAGKDPREAVGTVASPTGSTSVILRDGTSVSVDNNGRPISQTVYRNPTADDVTQMQAHKNDPAYKASFIRHFGPDAYKTHIEKQ